MSINLYPQTTLPPEQFQSEISQLKEFYVYSADNIDRTKPPAQPQQIQSYQSIDKNFINHSTPYFRFLIKHSTGAGKTYNALKIANDGFIKFYKLLYDKLSVDLPTGRKGIVELDRLTPNVFWFGFQPTKEAVYRDLLKFTEFGIVSHEDIQTLKTLRANSVNGGPSEERLELDFQHELMRKIERKHLGGFYKFYGYQQFIYRLIKTQNITLVQLETISRTTNKNLIDIINEYIAAGKISLNKDLLATFENSLIICDEIHDVYNSVAKNNYGVAIQILLDSVPSLRAIFLSATPINNSPTEVVDILNLLLPKDERVSKADLFDKKRLKPGAAQIIRQKFSGRVSFLQDKNPRFFPTRIYDGEELHLVQPIDEFDKVPYLKFISCEMSSYQINTIRDLEKTSTGDNESTENDELPQTEITDKNAPSQSKLTPTDNVENQIIPQSKSEEHATQQVRAKEEDDDDDIYLPNYKIAISPENYSILDLAFPNPNSSKIGLYKKREIKSAILSATHEQHKSLGIRLEKRGNIDYYTGEWLKIKNLGKYSAKYKQMMQDILHILKTEKKPAKILIYHNRIRLSGVALIQEILKQNGAIEENEQPNDYTICRSCGEPLSSHTKTYKCAFSPCRFGVCHSEISPSALKHTIAKFNSVQNAYGEQLQILVCSKIIRQGYEIKDTIYQFIMSMPMTIPQLIQIIGRVDRNNSHAGLPPELRVVHIRIYVNVWKLTDINAPEQQRYAQKNIEYMTIQEIEREMHIGAIDAQLNRQIILQSFGTTVSESTPTLGTLYYDVPALPSYNLADLNTLTYDAYNYNDEEIKIIIIAIKRLFIIEPIWTYDQLLEATRNPPFNSEFNMKLISETNFIIALHTLTKISNMPVHTNTLSPESRTSTNTPNPLQIIDKLNTATDQYITMGIGEEQYQQYKIMRRGKFYIRTPLNERMEPVLDIESWQKSRPISVMTDIKININDYLAKSKSLFNYSILKESFKKKICSGEIDLQSYEGIAEFLTINKRNWYIRLIEDMIQFLNYDTELISSEVPTKIKACDNKRIYESLAELFDKFGLLVYYKQLPRNIAEKIKSHKAPIGYIAEFNAKILQSSDTWIEISHATLDISQPKDNNIIVGYFEDAPDGTSNFKIRKPSHIASSSDSRTIERGIVCHSKPKSQILELAESLGIKIKIFRTRNMCNAILAKLIQKEMAEREKGTNIKYLYVQFP